jgi:chemotaxis protein histidine kinase CheA
LTVFNSTANFTDDLDGVLNQAVAAGEKTARRLKKNIEFETSLKNAAEISNKRRRLISECLLHLIRNAADHAIEQTGKIKIEIILENEHLILRVADDGRGLDAEKIKLHATEKNLIRKNENLSREEIFKLIFAPGFSTAERVSEISGRGVGLDVVQNSVEKAGGEIRVASEKNQGTVFEISLPPEK